MLSSIIFFRQTIDRVNSRQPPRYRRRAVITHRKARDGDGRVARPWAGCGWQTCGVDGVEALALDGSVWAERHEEAVALRDDCVR